MLESKPPLRAAIYVRVSTEEQADHGYSIDAQLDTLRKYCNLYEHSIYKEFVDRGISGKSMENRYELQQMLRDAKEGLFDEVLVWRINRLARRNIDLLQIVEQLDKYNVTFRSFSENFETATPTGKFALQMLGAVGELERNTILENAKMGLKQRARMGKHNAKPPLGYKIVMISHSGRKRETRVEVVPEEAAVVRRIFEQFASGRGLKSIANELNHDGLVTKTKNPFSTCAVKDILENPFYVGKVRYNRFENWSEKRRRGKSSEPILADGVHPKIISQDLWNKVHYLKQKKSAAPEKRFSGEYLLTGLIRCPKCGAAMTASRTNNRAKDGCPIVRTYYSCGSFRSKGSAVCSANSVRKDDAERAVFDRLKEVLAKPHVLRAIVKGVNDRKAGRVKPLQEELEAVRARIAEVQAKKLKYLELYEEDDVDRKLFSERLGQLESDLDRLHAKRSELELELDGDHSRPVTYEQVHSLIGRFEHLLRFSSFDQRKTLLHLIIRKITLNEKRQVDKIELVFDETTEQHFLSAAPSADSDAEGAFPFGGKAPRLNHRLVICI